MNPSSTNKNSVCFVHDWLVAMRGGEKVLEAMTEIFPDAPIYTLFYKKEKLSPALQQKDIRASFLQYIPGIHQFYRYLLPLFPLAIRFINVKNYHLVISSSHCVAKAVAINPSATHVCYCHTPMRYLWGFQEEYFGNLPRLIKKIINVYFKYLKKWDVKNSKGVDRFIANSQNTANKIKSLYGKEASVIHAPVDQIPQSVVCSEGEYYLLVSALVHYKRVDLAIEAFNRLRLPLKIIGDGPLKSTLQKMTQYPGIGFEGWVNQQTLWDRYSKCLALIFPGEEDFGIVPLEAQMFGKPVIAFGRGGVTESVIPISELHPLSESTGIFFNEPTAEALVRAIEKMKDVSFNSQFIRSHAEQFTISRFKKKIASFLAQ